MNKRKIGYIICLISVIWLNVLFVDYSVFVLLVMFICLPIISGIFMRISWLMANISVSVEKEVVIQGQEVKLLLKNKNRLANI